MFAIVSDRVSNASHVENGLHHFSIAALCQLARSSPKPRLVTSLCIASNHDAKRDHDVKDVFPYYPEQASANAIV